MNGLFSHQSSAAEVPEVVPEVCVSVTVAAPAEHAWAGLTEHLHLWWPAEELSRWGEDSFFDLEDNALVETSAQDDENVWGEVVEQDPGHWLELRWRHLSSATTTQVRLELRSVDGRGSTAGSGSDDPADGSDLALTITHSGWTTADPGDVYDFYRAFWPVAVARYKRFMGGS